jgi:Phosphotransferase enzyme family
MTDEEQLAGGVANAGSVTRVGDVVLRPSNPHSRSVHGFLTRLRAAGFDGASRPLGIGTDGRERLEFIAGDVPIPPYPAWSQADTALASIADLMRRFHDAARRVDPSGAASSPLDWSGLGSSRLDPSETTWNTEMADPFGGPIICHNDVCLENVVFRSGVAVGLVDFDFAAPGRPGFDLAAMARMCVPISDDLGAEQLGWHPADRPARLRLVTDVYGLDRPPRDQLLTMLDDSIASGGAFVRRRVEAGDPNFVKMWNELGGAERFARRRRWWEADRERFAEALR